MPELDAREEWLAGLAADYASAAREAREAAADYASAAREAREAAVEYDDPYDDADPEDDDHAATVWPPTAETGVHLVRTPPAPASVHGDRGDEALAGAPRPADRHDDGLPVPSWVCTCDGCWGCDGHVTGCTCDIDWDELAERSRP